MLFTSLSIFPFRGMKYPYFFIRGIDSSKSIFRGATALQVTMSYFSRVFFAYISILSFITVTFFRPSSATTNDKKWHFLVVASIRVKFNYGYIIFSTIPGNPAPAPTSHIV